MTTLPVQPPDAGALSCMLAASGACAALWQPEAACWLATPGLQASLGHPADWQTWDGARWASALHPDDLPAWKSHLQAPADPPPAALIRLRAHSGAWLRFELQPVMADGRTLLLLRDVTALTQVESALHDSQTRLNSLYDSAPIAIILWSREGRITGWNDMASQTFGHVRDQVVGQKLVPLLIAPKEYERFSRAIAASLADNAAQDLICDTLTADQRTLRCRWRSVPLRTRKGALTGIFSLAQDVTAELAAADSLRSAKDAAERLSQAKSEFMAVVGHELRTPLNGILGMAQILQLSELPAEDAELVGTIHDSGSHLLAIVNAIMRYAEADLGPENQRHAAFSPTEWALFGAQPLEFQASQKGLGFHLDIDPNLPEVVQGDEEALKHILQNLGENAVKFTESGEIRIACHGEPLPAHQLRLTLTVKDSGIGMASDFLAHLYQPFQQAENAILRKHGGVGLGLAIVRKLVDRIGGEITVDSSVGAGTTFRVRCVLTVPAA